MCSLQDLFFSSQNVWRGTGHRTGMLHGQKTQRKVQKRVMPSRSSEVWGIDERNKLPRPFTELTQVHSDKTAKSLNFSALVAYRVHLMS